MSERDFSDHVFAITGAAGRLGQRLGQRLLERGASVVALDRDAALDDLAWAGRDRAHPLPFDATDEASVAEAFRKARATGGRLDGLVHTVGTWDGAPLLDTSLADFERLLRLNLTSAFLCFREATRQMQRDRAAGEAAGEAAGAAAGAAPRKRLVGIASGQGADQGVPEQYGYSAAKAGVVRLVEGAARELAGSGITACAVAPSTILFDENGAPENGTQEGVPAGRLTALIEHVLSPAGDALNGATLRAYGSAV